MVCEGPRPSLVLQALLSGKSNTEKCFRIEIDATEEECNMFPRLLDYVYHGTKVDLGDGEMTKSLLHLATKFGVAYHVEEVQEEKEEVSQQELSGARFLGKHQVVDFEQEQRREQERRRTRRNHEKNSEQECSGAHSLGKYDLPTFKDLPTLLQSVQKEKYSEERTLAEDSIGKLLAQSDLDAVAIADTGTIPYLLQILSDDQYEPFHLKTAKLVRQISKHSETVANRLVSCLAVETLVTSQLVHKFDIRKYTLYALGHIANHSAALCLAVLGKGDCLPHVLRAVPNLDLMSAALFVIAQFCLYVPRQVLSNPLIEAIGQGLWPSSTDSNFKQASKSLVNVVNAMTKADSHSIQLRAVMGRLLNDNHKVLSLRALLQVTQHGFILHTILFHTHLKPFANLLNMLSFGDDRECQALACQVTARLIRYMRVTGVSAIEDYRSKKDDIASVLSKLVSYGGKAKIPAATAYVEMLRYSGLEEFTRSTGSISALCDVMRDSMVSQEHSLLTQDIMLALQRILASEIPTTSSRDEMHVLIGVKLAGAMTCAREQSNGTEISP